ncbi:MAG TPA: glycosyltransferase family 1 protein [Patescibacteria group bacterium]|nr:glycosyltransferase family 1 protein [Patescibacteria group bacterium]
MRIGIDCRLWGQPVGVGRYIRNLMAQIDLIDKKNEYVLFAKTEDIPKMKATIKKLKVSFVKTDIPWHGMAEQINLPKILNSQDLDLMHFPYFSVPIFYYKPFVVTVHDLIVNRFNTGRASTLPLPLYMAKRFGYHAVMANSIYRSKKIFVPSQSVKEDLKKSYVNLGDDKIVVTYEGALSPKIDTTAVKGELVNGKFLLRVGNFYPHKNVENLIKAFREFVYDSYENKDVKLVLVGNRDHFFKKIEKLITDKMLNNNIVFLENPSDSDLKWLYENASATIVPSFMEGFSLTAVEAMAFGSLLLVSDIPVHREVCQDAAIYFNPYLADDIEQKIDFAFSLIDKSKEEFIKQGKRRAKEFSWKKMAEETIAVYNSVGTS